MLSCSVARKAEVANVLTVHLFPPNSQCWHKIVFGLMNIQEQRDFLGRGRQWHLYSWFISAEQQQEITVKTITNSFTGPTKAARGVFPTKGTQAAFWLFHIQHLESHGQLLMPPWAEQCLGTPSHCPTLGHVHLPARGIAVGLGLYQLSVTIATLHLTSPCTKNRSPWSQGKKIKGNQMGQL